MAVTSRDAYNRNLSHVLLSIFSNVSEGVTPAVTLPSSSLLVAMICRSFSFRTSTIVRIAKEVCNVLDLGNVERALRSLDDDEKKTINTVNFSDGIRQRGNLIRTIINEPGL